MKDYQNPYQPEDMTKIKGSEHLFNGTHVMPEPKNFTKTQGYLKLMRILGHFDNDLEREFSKDKSKIKKLAELN